MGEGKFFGFLLRTSIRAAMSVRGAFLVESALMLGNNCIFLFIWWVFFRQFEDVAGWTLRDMIALNAVGMGGWGLMFVCFGGIRTLSQVIVEGGLDPFMTQPKNLLLHLIGSRSLVKGWGHLMTTLVLVVWGGFTTPGVLLLIVIGLLCACLIFSAVAVMAHSVAFWMGAVENVSKKYCDSLYLFALYPSNVYSGILKLIMFTAIPAGVIGYLPVELLRHFSWFKLILLLGSTAIFCILAFVIFYAGLRRYESGNQFGMRL